MECYELDQGRKKNLLDGFIKKNGLYFEKEAYWFLLGLLNSRFAILEKELEKILLLEDKNDPAAIANALNINRLVDANKFFFKIHLSSGDVTSFLNSSINSYLISMAIFHILKFILCFYLSLGIGRSLKIKFLDIYLEKNKGF